jgi:hypothetical protein
MSPGERLAILAATLGGPEPVRLLTRAPDPEETATRATALARAPRRERLVALAAATSPPRMLLSTLDGERAGLRRLAAALCGGAPSPLEPGRGPALARRLLLERLLSEGA